MKIKDIMTTEVITVHPETTLSEVGKILKEKRVSGVPVTDHENNVVGIITLTDMLRILDHIYQWREIEMQVPELKLSAMFEKEKTQAKVQDVMTKDVLTLDEGSSLDDIMRLMFTRKVHTIPVVARGNKLVGIVGKRDLVYACF
jgi:predicted transcriptional regulator